MTDANVKRIIADTVLETLIKLKKLGLMQETKKSSYNKIEELLRNYPIWKNVEKGLTRDFIVILERELRAIENDQYYEIIPMIYFENKSREDVAEYFDVNSRTITRNKNRLVNRLKAALFSDDVITELFL